MSDLSTSDPPSPQPIQAAATALGINGSSADNPSTPPQTPQSKWPDRQAVISPSPIRVPANSPASPDHGNYNSPEDPMLESQILPPLAPWHPSYGADDDDSPEPEKSPKFARQVKKSQFAKFRLTNCSGDAADDDTSEDSQDNVDKDANNPDDDGKDVAESGNDDSANDDDNTIEEDVLEPVVHEVVKPEEHDVDHVAVDKEIFDDEYHMTVQIVLDRQDDEDRVVRRVATLKEVVQDDRDEAAIQEHFAKEASEFHDERVVNETVFTHSVEPEVVTEHHHHHMHERIQPVIQRETHQRTVVHTTRPVHETHHMAPHFARPTLLPPITMETFLRGGGRLKRHAGVSEGEQAGGDTPKGAPSNESSA